jgi:hypothetical protein
VAALDGEASLFEIAGEKMQAWPLITFVLSMLWTGLAFLLVDLFRSWTPMFAMTVIAVIASIIFRAVRRSRNWTKRSGQCAACGYNLTGNTSGVCSECGTVISNSSERVAS